MFDWAENLLRSLSGILDGIVYNLINILYELFMTISNIAIIGQDTISEFTQRIYILIGIFMIFKITVSMISWYANPDSISDGKAGSGALIKRIVISLVCLAVVPWIFTFAYRIQYVILHENIIGNLVLGGMTTTNPNDSIKSGGNIMAIRTFQGFFYPENYVAGSFNDYDIAMSSTSWSQTKKFVDENLNRKENGEYIYHYQAFVSTLAGGFVAWILLIFCIDIAIRSVKLAFLQLIAPIPVLSYIDQKKGDKIFNNWVSECTKTYLDVFVRLIAIYFGIFLISEVCANFTNGGLGFNEYGPDGNIVAGSKSGNFFAQAFIIIGILLFVKELPKLIGDILGIKMGSGFTLNPLRKIGASSVATGLIAGGLGAVGGIAANTWAVGNKIKNHNLTDGFTGPKGVIKGISNVAGIAGGGISAGLRAGYAGLKSGGKGTIIGEASSGIKASNQARYNRDVYAGNPKVPGSSYSWLQRRKDDIDKFAGVKNKDAGVGKYDAQMKKLKQQMDNYNGQEQALREALTNYIAESKFKPSDFDENSLYVGGIKKLNANGQYDYVDWVQYVNAGGLLDRTSFEKQLSFQQSIDYYDIAFNNAREQYKQYEDAFKTRESAKKDK